MLPGSVAIVNRTFPGAEPGKALGTMVGVAAIAGALGPTIGGALTTAFSWRLVLLVNVPLAIVCLVATLSGRYPGMTSAGRAQVDFFGAGLCAWRSWPLCSDSLMSSGPLGSLFR